MKILAIRGCNLASLAGEFEIDLARGPLGAAGVFAIVGPTGAGKSTLLDAMCVALFDRTPRLQGRSTFAIGDSEATALGAQDVRSLLRRGASQGWAEVDFESGDSRRYRARWSVRRARGASDGRFQDEQITLTSLDPGDPATPGHLDAGGERFGGTKTETLRAIHQRLGLSFDQFRRSALLAQGDFAAFLKAEGKERSELLERMTGTEIYSRLSIAAHQRAALAEQQLRARHDAAMAIAVLADDARAAAEAELALAHDARTAARTRLAHAERAARWLAEATRHAAAVREADEARAAAEHAVAAAERDRDELALRRRAETLRPRWDEVARIERQLAGARAQAAEAADAAAVATRQQQTIAARREQLAVLHAPIREARIAAGLPERTPRPGIAAGRGDSAGDAADPMRARAALTSASWLVARAALAPEVAAWPELDSRFAQHAQLAEALARLEGTLADLATARAEIAAKHEKAAMQHRAAVERLGEAQREAAAFQQRRGLTLDAAGKQEDAARLHVAEIDRLAALVAEARGAATARAELDRQLAELAAAASADAEARRIAEFERASSAALRADRAHVVEELRRAAGYQHARAELVDGDPCPLCGATEHPWRDRGALDTLITDAEARLAEATARGDAAVAQLAQLAARDEQRGVERARLVSCRATAEATAVAAAAAWRQQLAVLGELLLVDDPASDAAHRLVQDRVDAARQRLEAARRARAEVEAVAKASQEALGRVHARQTEVEHHADTLAKLAAALAAHDASIERHQGERAGKLERHAELTAAISAAVARWQAAAPSDLAAVAPADLSAAAWADLAAAGPLAVDATRRALAQLAATWRDHADRVADADAALAAALAAVDRAAREAERTVAEQDARRAEAEKLRDALTAELAFASAALAAERAAAGFDAAALRDLLAAEPGRVDALASRLEALDRAADRARTLAAERRRLAADHAATRPFAVDEAGAPATAADAAAVAGASRLPELAAAVAQAEAHAATLAATLAADTDARARRAAALAEAEAADRAAEVDRVLGDLIGSHDGKLFRSFAQSLTLDSLLAVANSHLEELAPRYQLERVPRHDLELQVIDRDLGGDIRSVQSLSGGESFLVSLALALGLSSMSAHDVRVRTLLIDEGFGTLDPATLDTALAVLDALQATGRQVGVISHVPALVERVGAHVRVAPRGGGRSEVLVAEA
jgi:exonuclease SbcC